MSGGHYQILFSGEVVDGADVDIVRENLRRELGVLDSKLTQIFSGRTVVLRSDMSHHDAEAFQGKLARLGAICRIKNLDPDERAKYRVDKSDKVRVDYTLRDITAAHIDCPRCGHMQLETQFCARCGVDIRATIKQKRKEDLLIQKKIRELRQGQRPTTPVKELGPIKTEPRSHIVSKPANPFGGFRFPWRKR